MYVQYSELFLDIKNLVYFLLLHVAVLFNVIIHTYTSCMVYVNVNIKYTCKKIYIMVNLKYK